MPDTQTVAEAAAHLRSLLAQIEAGEMTCSAATQRRIEGAALAFESTTDARSSVSQTHV